MPIPIVVAGDLALKHVIVENDAIYPASLQGRTSIERFSYVVGATYIEFLLNCCREYKKFCDLNWKNIDDEMMFFRKYREDVAGNVFYNTQDTNVFGPSSISDKDTLVNSLLQETVTYARTKSIMKDSDVAYEGYRRSQFQGTTRPATSITTPLLQQLPPNSQGSMYTLYVDFEEFLKEPIENYFDNTSGSSIQAGSIAVRLHVKPGSLNGFDQDQNQVKVSKNLCDFLDRNSNKKRIAILSAETLRACNADISYRVTWERTISDTLKALGNVSALKPALECLQKFDTIVVTYSNDGALIVPHNLVGTSGAEGNAIFVAVPNGIEHDFRNGFTGRTRGTESLVTASIAFHIASMSEADFNNKNSVAEKLTFAVTLGLKASRYLQAHSWVTVEPEVKKYVREKDFMPSDSGNDQEKILYKLSKNWGSRSATEMRSSDSTMFLWNRIQSGRFVEIYQTPFLLSRRQFWSDDSKTITWPIGDLAEIISEGFPTYGSFPPTAFMLNEGRSVIYRQTSSVANAWSRAGWLSVSQIPLKAGKVADPIPSLLPPLNSCELPETEYDKSWWSLRQVSLDNLTRRIYSCIPIGKKITCEEIRDIVSHQFYCCLTMFGNKQLNSNNTSPLIRFDTSLVYRSLKSIFNNLNIDSKEYGEVLNNFLSTYSVSSVGSAKESIVEGFIAGNEEKFARNFNSFLPGNLPHGRAIDLIPELQIGMLYSIDRRDIHSFRDVRERLINYQKSNLAKPLNIGVFGSPGNGKSFAVKEILQEVYRGTQEVEFLEYNLAQFSSPSDLTDAFLEIQNVSLNGKLPIAFWDEYDTQLNGEALGWLSFFLGPMQDGKFFVDQKIRTLPRCIFIFAGSMFTSFGALRVLDRLSRGKAVHIKDSGSEKTLELSEKTRIGRFTCDEWQKAKGSDFTSRLTSVLDISGISPSLPLVVTNCTLSPLSDLDNPNDDLKKIHVELTSDPDSNLVRRAMSIRSICKRDAPHLFDKNDQLAISDSVLSKFLKEDVDIEHGMRSLESLIRMSALQGRTKIDKSVVPTAEQVRIHAKPDLFKD